MRVRRRSIHAPFLPVLAALALAGAFLIFAAAAAVPASVAGSPAQAAQPRGAAGETRLHPALGELAAVRESYGDEAARGYATARGIRLKDGGVTVVIESAGQPATALVRALAAGSEVEAVHGDLVQVAVPLEAVTGLAASLPAGYVRPPMRPQPLAVTSEGVADAGAGGWHANGFDGSGVKVAVTDLGFTGYEGQIAAGELPADVTVVSFNGDITGGGTAHGTACAEIVHDMAPGAQLYLLNFSTEVELGNMIDYMISEGIDVVSASWAVPMYFRGDGEGIVNEMAAEARAAGIYWVNAAGNSAQNHWGGPFSDPGADGWHDFAPGDSGNSFVAAEGELLAVYLSWDRWPATDQDYDLYLYREGVSSPVASSTGPQGGTEMPYEEIYYVVPPGMAGTYYLSIHNAGAAGDAVFQLYCHFGVLEYQVAAGSLAGQPADSADVTTVGAVFVGTGDLMYYSSRGPTTDGRVKPDLVGPTHVSTGVAGPLGFGGTSGATPHVAGAAALLASAMPAFGPDEIGSWLEEWAADLGPAGKDSDYGSGKLDLSACTRPLLGIASPVSFWESYADYLDRDLSVTWSVQNSGAHTAYGVTLVGSVNTSEVTLLSAMPMPVGDVAIGAGPAAVTLKYRVPLGVIGFMSTTYAIALDLCGTSYSYPGVMPG